MNTQNFLKHQNFRLILFYSKWYCVSILVLAGCILLTTRLCSQNFRDGRSNQRTEQINSSGSGIKIARVKYSGGGDWYNDPSAEVNLMKYVRQNTNIPAIPIYEYVDLNTDNIFNYPLLFMTGHGNVNLSDGEVRRLRAYLQNGGFLYIDDDYGMDISVRREMKKIFADQQPQELPYSHPLFTAHFTFSNGVPKIHEHDNKPAQCFGWFYQQRLCILYTYESNPSDGWADPDVHSDPPEKREAALKFGTNIIVYALSGKVN